MPQNSRGYGEKPQARYLTWGREFHNDFTEKL